MQSTAKEIEALLRRAYPGIEKTWRGASPEDIEELEDVSGGELPEFYRWFLERMGASMGSFAFPTLDFSARRVIAAYENDGIGWDARYRLVAWQENEQDGTHVFYDLARRVRDDALVVNGHLSGIGHAQFETLAEKLAWHATVHRVFTSVRRTHGLVVAEPTLDLATIRPAMQSLGFVEPLASGLACGVFEREDAFMAYWQAVERFPAESMTFELGTRDEARARQLLGEVGKRADVQVEIWP